MSTTLSFYSMENLVSRFYLEDFWVIQLLPRQKDGKMQFESV